MGVIWMGNFQCVWILLRHKVLYVLARLNKLYYILHSIEASYLNG